ncbi:hypothetical protein PINS_up002011 [Pythium insidiosum]|nr:hypothetical protein PINS_up002011 [Pythium insidiosum]
MSLATVDSPTTIQMAVVKKPRSAYFIFSGEKRKEITDANPGLRVGDVQKLITARWKELTPEEKEVYLDLAAKDKERYERERLENPVDDAPADVVAPVEVEHACLYPLGRVKRIIQSDPDVNKVSREALVAISKASELFAQYLATKSYEQTLFNNKRQVKASDVARAIHTTPVLDWLRDDFPDMKQSAATQKSKPSKPQGPVEPGTSVSTFFKPGTDREGALEVAEPHGMLPQSKTSDAEDEMDVEDQESQPSAHSHD